MPSTRHIVAIAWTARCALTNSNPRVVERDEEAYDTIAGLIVHRLGRIPAAGEEVAFRDDVVLRVKGVDARRVTRIRASRQAPSPSD